MRQKNEIILRVEYVALLSDIKKRMISARIKTARSVNKAMIRLYWEIGKLIAEKQAQNNWGDGIVEKLSSDLCKEFHNTFGLSVQNLWYMRKLYREYKDKPIL
jgi:predicted nuclease of restriction endonuclease-like (RecB) superfamily